MCVWEGAGVNHMLWGLGGMIFQSRYGVGSCPDPCLWPPRPDASLVFCGRL